MVVDLQCYEGRSLDVIQQAESLGAYGAPIAADYATFTAANVIVETADRLTDEAVAAAVPAARRRAPVARAR